LSPSFDLAKILTTTSLASWRSPLAKALHQNRRLPQSRYPQLATVDLVGRPANRTVVFRGFYRQTNCLQFITDVRSAKATQILTQPATELCWYFPNSREQFRIGGDLVLVTAQTSGPNLQQPDLQLDLQSSRIQLWQQLSDAARRQFMWPEPGALRQPPSIFPEPSPESQTPDEQVPLAQFCLLLLVPLTVDHLLLRGSPQQRWRYAWQPDTAAWSSLSINP
jgi:pyridoxamine 5'-phosphate oxidase